MKKETKNNTPLFSLKYSRNLALVFTFFNKEFKSAFVLCKKRSVKKRLKKDINIL